MDTIPFEGKAIKKHLPLDSWIGPLIHGFVLLSKEFKKSKQYIIYINDWRMDVLGVVMLAMLLHDI